LREGAEIGILRNMTIRPPAIAVETHGVYGYAAVCAPSIVFCPILKRSGFRASRRSCGPNFSSWRVDQRAVLTLLWPFSGKLHMIELPFLAILRALTSALGINGRDSKIGMAEKFS
jgi:hypothetical protein